MAVLQTLVTGAPCTISYKSQADGTFDAKGRPVPGKETWSAEIPCDAVPAGKANERVFDDGVRRSYSHVVYLKKDCPDFVLGQTVKLTYATTGKTTTHKVLGFHRYQLQAKLWV
jgi:hypothetical protein